jgi:signal transduction histidine kinase
MTGMRLHLPRLRHSLSAKLLLLTILFVMVAEVLIYTPSIARFRRDYLEQRIGVAHVAALALEATPTHAISPALEIELLQYADAYSVVLDMHGQSRMLIMNRDMPPVVDANYDMRRAGFFRLIANAFVTLVQTRNRVIRVVGPSPKNPGILVEIVIDEGPMRRDMYEFSWRILSLSIVISLITAGLLYLSLQWLLVRPMRRITEGMQRFRADPEDGTNVIPPSERRDEIGVATRELAAMQTELRAALHQKTRLAMLGSAVTKITHDLRNILATAQLVSDRLADSLDPTVKRVVPTLVGSIDRAISLCLNTMRFAKEERETPQLQAFPLRPLVDDVGATLAPQAPAGSEWVNEVGQGFMLTADREQMFRVLLNLGRNAYEAGARRVAVAARSGEGAVELEVADDGDGVAAAARERLFQAFSGTAKPGGTGLGLAIARDLLRAHGGEIRLAESRPGATRFLMILPARRAAAA